MAKLTPDKRARIEKLVVSAFAALDETGANAAKYEKELKGMSDAQFTRWLDEFVRNEDKHFYLDVQPFHNEPTLEQIEKAAKITGTKLHQYVYFKHDGAQGDPVRTAKRLPCGYIHVRRLQQILAKKTSYSTEASKRSQLTGQLSGDDAVGRLADEEAYALKTVGANAILRELLGPRADNRGKRLGMYHAIERDGYVQYKDLVGDTKDQPTLNYLNTLLLAAGLKSDLVDSTELLRVSVDRPIENQRK
jgi:hypothetical protein